MRVSKAVPWFLAKLAKTILGGASSIRERQSVLVGVKSSVAYGRGLYRVKYRIRKRWPVVNDQSCVSVFRGAM